MSIILTPEVTLAALQKRNANTMSEWLGIEFIELTADYLIAKMPVDHRTIQPLGVVNGGAFCALSETVGSMAANLCIDREKYVAVGLDINANHVRSAHKGWVYGKATPIHIGRSTHVWEIKITNDEGKLCCISRLTMSVIDLKSN
ncbi:MAG: hotdog fold thioesterase [Bacteroidota bacterium]